MELDKLSNQYMVHRLDSTEIESVFMLCSKNLLYYEYCPPFVTREGIKGDMEALPAGKTKEDKYFLGYYKNGNLIAILDLIIGYPNISTAYIGFFMTDICVQGKGVGTEIIDNLCDYLKMAGFQRVELAWVKGNAQSEKFWIKNHFLPIGERSSNAAAQVIAAARNL